MIFFEIKSCWQKKKMKRVEKLFKKTWHIHVLWTKYLELAVQLSPPQMHSTRKLKQNNQVMMLRGGCLSTVEYLEVGGDRVLGPLCPLLPPQGTQLCLPHTGPGEQRFLSLSIAWWGGNAEEEERWQERAGFGICQMWLLVCFALGRETMGEWGSCSLSSSRELQLGLKNTHEF